MCIGYSKLSIVYKYDRKVAVAGRSMVNVVNIAYDLGYLTIPEGVLIELDEVDDYPRNKVVVLTTGSQGSLCHL